MCVAAWRIFLLSHCHSQGVPAQDMVLIQAAAHGPTVAHYSEVRSIHSVTWQLVASHRLRLADTLRMGIPH